MDSVLYVLWRGFVNGQCDLCVVAWFGLWTVCCMCCGIGLFVDSVLYVLWSGFFNGQCDLCVVVWVC
jgi:hypothetical protein